MNHTAPLQGPEIQRIVAECGLRCPGELADEIETYLALLAKWNDHLNLTGIRDPSVQLRTLFCESFLAARLLDPSEGSILDVGSGAGFPGMAMALYCHDLRIILLEPRKKRLAFLNTVLRELGLTNVSVCEGRLENSRQEDFPVPPATVTARGLGDLTGLVRAASRLLCEPRKILLFLSTSQIASVRSDLREVHWDPPTVVSWHPGHQILLGRLP